MVSILVRKFLSIPLFVLFMDLGFLLFAREVFMPLPTIIPILLFNIFVSIDIMIRPTSVKKDEYPRSILIISFLCLPIILLLPYSESKFSTLSVFPPLITSWNLFIGTGLLVAGGVLLLVCRIQLGEFGSSKIVIEDKHQLITTGVYQHIRHPIYLGFLLLFSGYCFAVGSVVITMVISVVFFLIFKNRMDIEEKLLISTFGEEFLAYMESTKRIFPLLY